MSRNIFLSLLMLIAPPAMAEPPFWGTIFIDPDIIVEADPTTFDEIEYAGRGVRTMFDRRSGWVQLNAYLFNATFTDGLQIEFQVNPEFGSVNNARIEVDFYAPVIGRLPKSLRMDVETSWIHKGDEPFGGGNNNLLIHTGSFAQGYIEDGILEETFVHEASHTSLDAYHADSQGWRAAQQTDPDFISTYAEDFPDREDIAESFLTYLAVRYRADRISQQMEDTIRNTIPNRIEYFEQQDLDMLPIADPLFTINAGLNDAWVSEDAPFQGLFFTVFPDLGFFFLSWFTFDSVLPIGDDTAGFGAFDQRWVTGGGFYVGNSVTISVELTSGGIFNGSNPMATQQTGYGTITIVFNNCNEAVLSYNFPSVGLSGQMTLTRVLPDNVALCNVLADS